MSLIPYGRHSIDQDDIDAVVEVLRSDWLTQGPVVPRFEKQIGDYCGVDHVVATNSATSALHLACLALNVGPGDIVWTSPISFVASANCALYCGATVNFVDIDPSSYNLSVECLVAKLVVAKSRGVLPKVVIPVHLCGQACDMAAIFALGQQYGFKIIEDASHAIGGKYQGQPIGNCKYSDITVFSFHPVKIITTAEGGAALTNSKVLFERMSLYRSHGITRDSSKMTKEPDGPWYYEQLELGFNYRLTDIQAALGASQMLRLDKFVAQRHEIAARYDRLLEGKSVVCPYIDDVSYSSYHLYVVRLVSDRYSGIQRKVFDGMRAQGIGVNLHYMPIYRQPYYQKLGFVASNYPNAEKYYSQAVTLPLYPGLLAEEQIKVVNCLLNLAG